MSHGGDPPPQTKTAAINDRYVLEREIGRGASGSVWVAHDLQLARRVAVKILRSESVGDGNARAQITREAQTIAQLRSPHIVQVHDAGEHESQPYIVMELLEGESLDARLRRQPKQPLALVARVVRDVAEGLTMTHRRGIVHRDLKPANIFMARERVGEVAKLLDFGIATLKSWADPSGSLEETTVRAGTPFYMSPEQMGGQPVDHQADLWALGVLAYQMVTGRLPFEGETLAQLRSAMREGHFAAPSSLVPGSAGPALDAFFRRALAAQPLDRFKSAAEVSAELLALAEAHAAPVTRILFIDDEPDTELLVRQRFRRQLREGRFELHFALEGAAGLEELRQRPDIDVVLTDLNMPTMNGLTFLKNVPSVNPLVRVVVVSAYSDMENIRAAMNLGAFDFLGKPIDFEDLERTVAKGATDASTLRQALRAHEENGILRALVGPGASDRLVTMLRAASTLAEESFDGSVVFVRIPGVDEAADEDGVAGIFDHLNAHFELCGPDILAQGGVVHHFIGAALLAVFRGEGHLTRALDASLAIRDRMRAFDDTALGGQAESSGIAIGIDTGLILAGGSGSVRLGRVEHTVLGEPVSTAARLTVRASKDEILVSAGTYGRIAKAFVCEPYPADRGAGEPPSIYRVIGRDCGRDEGLPVLSATRPLITRAPAAPLPEAPSGSLGLGVLVAGAQIETCEVGGADKRARQRRQTL